MLILVSVTISMAINGGLFEFAGKAKEETENAIGKEQELAGGQININNVVYDSIDDYIAGIPSGPVKIKLGRVGTKVTEVPLPSADFEHVEGSIETGYVIRHKTDGNEFVWVPVEKEQKLTIEIESKTDIKELKVYDPYGDLILEVADGDIETSYKNTNIEPTVNGMYMAVTKTEGETAEEVITQRTITVKSLYALDTMNDWYCTDEFAKSNDFNNLEEYALDFLNKKGIPSLEAGLAYFNVPTLEVGMSLISTTMLDFWKNYQDTEDYRAEVEKNGGFYIARYEAGTNPDSPRTSGSSSAEVSAIITANGKPVSKEGYAPYNYVTHSQAVGLAESMYVANDSYEVSLITGSGWDRTLGWIQETGRKSAKEIARDSTNWGNYNNAEFEITKGKYSENYGSSYTSFSGTYKKPAGRSVLVTTGATTRNSANNIFDLAGNVWEWTNSSYSSDGRVIRGGSCNYDGFSDPAASRNGNASDLYSLIGFRGALYLK